MTDWITWSNRISSAWADWLWPLVWQAAVVVAIAWMLTLVLRRSSPWLRSWVWRLAYLKLIVLMLWSTPIKLAVLPAAPAADAETKIVASLPESNSQKVEATNSVVDNTDRDATAHSTSSQIPPGAVVNDKPAQSAVAESSEIHIDDTSASNADQTQPIEFRAATIPAVSATPPQIQIPAPVRLSLMSYLLFAWSIGLIAVITWLAVEIWRTLRLRRSIRLIDRPELQSLLQEVRGEFKLRSTVRLGESELTHGPMLVKFLQPVVVFPSGMLATGEQGANVYSADVHSAENRDELLSGLLTRDEIRLVLAHEVAHLKRYDLTWNALAAVVHVLLYFHPLVWAAHRLARQEQELACDELVVTRLGVKRHEYGQMLVKIVRQIGRGFRPGVAVVGMSASYETLSRRIEAMTHIHVWNRKQIAMLGLVMVAVGLIAIVPWQVVAQDVAPAAPNETKEAAAKANETKSGETGTDAAQKSQIVGAWHGVVGSSNANQQSTNQSNETEIVFRPDGTYLDYSMRLSSGGPYTTDRGHWSIDGKKLTLTADPPALPRLEGFSMSKPTENAGAAPEAQKREFTILLLDDSLLRLKAPNEPTVGWDPVAVPGGAAVGAGRFPGATGGGFPAGLPGMAPPANANFVTYFYRRDKSVPADQKYDPSIPKQLQHIAELAGLTPPEALELAKHVKQLNEKLTKAGGKQLDLEWVERVADARDGKLNFQKLFQMTDAETKAFANLMQLTDMHFQGAMNLLSQDQLTADEASAVKKMFDVYTVSLVTAFGSPAEALAAQADPKSGNVWLGVSPMPAGGVQENPFGPPGAAMGGFPAGVPEGAVPGGLPAANAEMSVNAKMLAKMQNYVQGQATWLSATVFDR